MAGPDKTLNLQKVTRRLWQEQQASDDEPDSNSSSSSSSENEEIYLSDEIRRLRSSAIVEQQENIIYRITRMWRREPAATAHQLFQSGIVPRFVELLKNGGSCTLQYYTAMIIRKLASGTPEQTMVLVEYQAVPNLHRLMSSESGEVQWEAMLALGEIATDREGRKHVLDQGVLASILEVLDTNDRVFTTTAAACCLSQLCQGDLPDENRVLSTLHSLLQSPHNVVLEHASLAVALYLHSAIGEDKDVRMRVIIEQGLLKSLVRLLTKTSGKILGPVLTIMGEFSFNEDLLPTLINHAVLPKLLHLLENSTEALRRKALNVITNITAGSHEHVQAVVDEYIFPSLVCILDSNETQLHKGATEAIYNAVCKGTADHIQALVQMGCVESLCDLLKKEDKSIVVLVLKTLLSIMAVEHQEGGQQSPKKVKKKSGVEMLQKLLSHEDKNIKETASLILERFFGNELGWERS